jgi:peptidyl-prolyl cis-trans isomerase C
MKIHSTITRRSNLILAALLAFCPLTQAAETNVTKASTNPMALFDEVVAKGDGVSVTRAMLDQALITIKAAAAARGQQIPPQSMRALEAQVLSRIIGMQILNPRATEADKAAGSESAQKQLTQMREAAGSETAFTRQLKTVGMTLDELTKKMTEEATADAVLRRELKFDVKDAEVKKFYTDNPDRFEKPEMVRVAHILVGTTEPDRSEMSPAKKKEQLALAEKLKKRADAGEDFGKLAREFSDDPGSKGRGGEYTFPKGEMVTEFEAVAFAQQTNQISAVVTTKYGYHIIKTLEKLPARTVSYDEASPDIRKFLEFRGLQGQIPAYMEKREAEAHVEILDTDLKKIIDDANAAAKKAAAAAAADDK